MLSALRALFSFRPKLDERSRGARADYWRRMFLKMALEKLSHTQKAILARALEKEACGLTLTGLARALSIELGIPLSTVKWNLFRLRDLGLIIGGDGRARRKPFRLSRAGRALAKAIASMGR